jgi:chorismate mutase
MEARVRAVRGATTVPADLPEEIAGATTELVAAVLAENQLAPERVISVLFTVTEDLTSAFPATAARHGGLRDAALICAREVPVPGSLPRCIRLLMHAELECEQAEVAHVYLRGAEVLRDDLLR